MNAVAEGRGVIAPKIMEMVLQKGRDKEANLSVTKILMLLIFIAAVCQSRLVIAEEPPEELPVDSADQEMGLMGLILNTIDDQQASLSRSVIGFSENVDRYFINTEQDSRLNFSHIQLGYRYTLYEGNVSTLEPVISGRIHLPRTENRLSIEVSSSRDGNDPEADVTNDAERMLGLGLGYISDLPKLFTAKLRGGFKMVDSTFTFYSNLRLYRRFFFDTWSLQLSEDLYRDSVVSRLAKTEMLFERKISEKKLFRSITRNLYYFDLEYVQNDQTFYMIKQLSDKDALIYQLGASWTRPMVESEHSLDSYYNLIRYSRKVYKDWLFFEVSPQIYFLKENNFSPTPLLHVQFTAFFGNKKR